MSVRMMMQGGGAWSPADLADLAAWYDASDTTTITSASGRVSAFADKGPNGYNLSQGTGTRQPKTGAATLNGLNVLSWDGDYDMDYDAGSDAIDLAPLTVCAVVTADPTNNQYRRIISARRSATTTADYEAANFLLNRTNVNTPTFNMGGNGVQASGPTGVASTGLLVTGKATASGVSIAVDGGTPVTASGTATISAMRYLRLGNECPATGNPPDTVGGASSEWRGDIAEVVLVAADLTGTDLDNLQTYLADKWGITL